MDDDPRDDPRDEQIEALRREAAAAGDDAQERICTDALRGNQAARRACAAVIAEARAQQDPPGRECECTCGCEEPATGTDDGGNPSCDECADYYCDAARRSGVMGARFLPGRRAPRTPRIPRESEE